MRVVHHDINDRRGKVIVEAGSMAEVMSTAARQLAIQTAAANGLSRPGTSGRESAYPVDSEGKCSEEVQTGRTPVAAYRCDYELTGAL